MRHVRNYASAGVISALVGVFTFPILTRYLSVEDYGIIGLITASTTLAAAFGKLGLQHAIVRFYAESRYENKGRTLLEFNTTVFTVFTVLSVIAWLAWIAAGTFVVPRFIENENITTYFWIVSLVIIFRMVGSATWNMLRARQNSAAVSTTTILSRLTYLSILFSLLFTGHIKLGTLLFAFVIAELVGVIYATRKYRPHFSFDWKSYSPALVKALLMFGLPLMVLESLNLILRLMDRYMISSFLGDRQLGLYAASYNLSSYVELIITGSIAAAVRPMYTDIWETAGEKETCQFLSKGLHIYFMVGIPFMVTFVLVAPHLLSLLASERYQSGTTIIPYIATTILLDGSLIFLSAGLYFRGSTNTLVFWGLVAGVINLVGNYFVIPVFGIEGAAAITLTAFCVFATGIISNSWRLLQYPLPFKNPAIILGYSLIVYWLLNQVDMGGHLRNMLVKGTAGTAILFTLILFVDPVCRSWFADVALNLRSKIARR